MSRMILITKANCQKCMWLKDKIGKRNDIYEFDITNSDLPILIDGKTGNIIVSGAINIKDYLGIGEKNDKEG